MAQSFHRMSLRIWYGILFILTLFGYHMFSGHVDVYAMILAAWVLFAFFAIFPQRAAFFRFRSQGTAHNVLRTLDIKELSDHKIDTIFDFMKVSMALLGIIILALALQIWAAASALDHTIENYLSSAGSVSIVTMFLGDLERLFGMAAPYAIACLSGMMSVFFASCQKKTMPFIITLTYMAAGYVMLLYFGVQSVASLHALSFVVWILAAYVSAKAFSKEKTYHLYQI